MTNLAESRADFNPDDYLSLWTKPKPLYVVGSQPRGSRLELDRLLREIAADHTVTTAEIMSRCRLRHVAWARQAFMAIAWETKRFSEPRIAAYLSVDHSSVNHGKRRHWGRTGTGPEALRK